jgi:hypothetical protein
MLRRRAGPFTQGLSKARDSLLFPAIGDFYLVKMKLSHWSLLFRNIRNKPGMFKLYSGAKFRKVYHINFFV